MDCRSVIFECPIYLHMRPIYEIVRVVDRFNARLTVHKEEVSVSALSMLDMLTLAVCPGDTIQMTAEGDEADRMLDAIRIMLLTFSESEASDKDVGSAAA